MKGQTRLFSLRLFNAQYKEIARIAKRECRTMASIIRQSVKEFLERDKEREERK